jgi:hypothetical protein
VIPVDPVYPGFPGGRDESLSLMLHGSISA